MKLKAFFIFHFSFFILLASCGGEGNPQDNTVSGGDTKSATVNAPGTLVEERTFKNNIWNSQSPEVFEIDITDSNAYYTFVFTVAIDTAVYRYETFPFYTDI